MSDAGAPVGRLTSYTPSIRDRLNRWLAGDHPDSSTQHFVDGMIGITGEKAGLIDYTPAGIPLNAYEAGRSGREGNYVNAALSGLSIVPNALAGPLIRKLGQTLKDASYLKNAGKFDPTLTDAASSVKMAPQTAPGANVGTSRRGFLGGIGAPADAPKPQSMISKFLSDDKGALYTHDNAPQIQADPASSTQNLHSAAANSHRDAANEAYTLSNTLKKTDAFLQDAKDQDINPYEYLGYHLDQLKDTAVDNYAHSTAPGVTHMGPNGHAVQAGNASDQAHHVSDLYNMMINNNHVDFGKLSQEVKNVGDYHSGASDLHSEASSDPNLKPWAPQPPAPAPNYKSVGSFVNNGGFHSSSPHSDFTPNFVLSGEADNAMGNNWQFHPEFQTQYNNGDTETHFNFDLRHYTGTGANTVNHYLRNGDLPKGQDYYSPEDMQKFTMHMDGRMKPLSEPITVYRGESHHVPFNVGDEFYSPSYTSTSGSAYQANDFASHGQGTQTIFRIDLPAGHKAIVTNPAEKEVILPRNMKFRVTSVQNDVPGSIKNSWKANNAPVPTSIQQVVHLEPQNEQ